MENFTKESNVKGWKVKHSDVEEYIKESKMSKEDWKNYAKELEKKLAALQQDASQAPEQAENNGEKPEVLVTDAWRAYKTYANEKGIAHYRIKSDDGKHVIKGLYHIQNVNGLHSRLKNWINRFNGVASKYLDNYLAWFLFVDSHSSR